MTGTTLSSGRWMAGMLMVATVLVGASPAGAQQAGVAGTKHNLSVSGPGEIRSLTETEVCKFCHIPHSAVEPVPLWGHALSTVPRYDVPVLQRGRQSQRPAPQPDGSSRLCLSCHDGTVALGDVAGEPQPISMRGAQHLTFNHRGYIGTDLSGSHPISFVVDDGRDDGQDGRSDMRMKPLAAISTDPDVNLDHAGKMQCTTCHDPHSDRFFIDGRVPHFWVKPTVDEVCTTCHELR